VVRVSRRSNAVTNASAKRGTTSRPTKTNAALAHAATFCDDGAVVGKVLDAITG
jgi:hypothetical protein